MKKLLTILTLFIAGQAFAQDLHFSQFFASQLNLNPALTGAIPRDYRLVGNIVSQWGGFTEPYVSMSASYDMQLHWLNRRKRIQRDSFGGGFVLISDKAGDSQMSTTQVNMSIAYDRFLDSFGKHHLRFGLQAGFAQRKISTAALQFDDQFNGLSFDPGINTLEKVSNDNFIYPDITPGVLYYFTPNDRTNFNIGFARSHVNRPAVSFFGDKSIRLFEKNTIHAGGQFRVNAKIDLLPSVLIMTQSVSREINFGSFINYHLIPQDLHTFKQANILFGTWYRLKDAVILASMFEFDEFSFGLSYALNVSDLRKATKLNGGPELSITYLAFLPEKLKSKKGNGKYCPRFM